MGCKVKEQHLIQLLQTVKEYYPAFPDEGTLDVKVWEDAGGRLRSLQDSGVSIGTPNLLTWGLVRTALLPIWARRPELFTEEDKSLVHRRQSYVTQWKDQLRKFCLQPCWRTCFIAGAPYFNPGSIPPHRMAHCQESQEI